METNYREFGRPPFGIAVLHGGPGAAGEMAPVARQLAGRGVLEPLQTADSVDGQVKELKAVLAARAKRPAVLIGFSWGAWLGCLLAARHPEYAKKLVLVGSGPLTETYAAQTLETRLSRIGPDEQAEVRALLSGHAGPAAENADLRLARLGALFSRADTFDPLTEESASAGWQGDIFEKVWPEAAELRKNGTLLKLCGCIRCPVTAIHGDYDPHPAAGVREPLAGVIRDFRFILLERCGHKPWLERQAQARFYEVLAQELKRW